MVLSFPWWVVKTKWVTVATSCRGHSALTYLTWNRKEYNGNVTFFLYIFCQYRLSRRSRRITNLLTLVNLGLRWSIGCKRPIFILFYIILFYFSLFYFLFHFILFFFKVNFNLSFIHHHIVKQWSVPIAFCRGWFDVECRNLLAAILCVFIVTHG